jgi:hypothetical protein
MFTKTSSSIAAGAVLLGLFFATPASADDCDRIDKFLDAKDVYGYLIYPITDEYVARTFPGRTFCAVIFRQWPVAFYPPEDLAYSNVGIVARDQISFITSTSDLRNFFAQLGPITDPDAEQDAGRTWLRLSEELEQDLFFTFSAPSVQYSSTKDGSLVTGQVVVLNGGTGEIDLRMPFDGDGNLGEVQETSSVRAGIRPICQATKLLDRDPLVRRMAEQDILVMGRSAKSYLDQQRAKANPKLKRAIDRIWQQIVDEGR